MLRGSIASSQHSHSATGSLAYRADQALAQRTLVWVDRQGNIEPIDSRRRGYVDPRLSPDGSQILVTVSAADQETWLFDIQREAWSRLTFDKDAISPIWVPGGDEFIFSSNRLGSYNLFRQSVDGSGDREQADHERFLAGSDFDLDE